MRNPENVLKSLSEKAKNKEYRYERLYRNLYNPEFYLLAYQNIATSQGSMTAGADGLTLDGMSMHHVKRLKDLNADNEFDELMLQKRRKSLALCPKCYEEAKLKSLKL